MGALASGGGSSFCSKRGLGPRWELLLPTICTKHCPSLLIRSQNGSFHWLPSLKHAERRGRPEARVSTEHPCAEGPEARSSDAAQRSALPGNSCWRTLVSPLDPRELCLEDTGPQGAASQPLWKGREHPELHFHDESLSLFLEVRGERARRKLENAGRPLVSVTFNLI